MKLSAIEVIGLLLTIGFIGLGLATKLDIFLWFGAISLTVGILIGEVLER